METFPAEMFCHIAKELGTLRLKVENAGLRASASPVAIRALSKSLQDVVAASGANREGMREWLHTIERQCKSIGLDVTASMVSELCEHTERGISFSEEFEAMACIESSLKHEMATRAFMYMPPERARYYAEEVAFGEEVNTKFPTASFDIKEAGNCYATGRSTACVFHLMRVMELGVQALGTKLGVSLVGEKVWQNILDEVNKAIKVLPPKDPLTVQKSQVSANLYSVKLAWRNEVMHPKDTYTLEEAENLMLLVKNFMRELASIV